MPPLMLSDLEGILFNNVVSSIIPLSTLLLLVFLIIGGFKYITSGGDPAKAEAGKKTITFAIAGIFLVALSYLILKFIGDFTGVDVTNFQIKR